MSWALEEWKEGLPTRALQKIQELEGQLDKLKKEKQQRQFQLDSLEAALQKQKQKVSVRQAASCWVLPFFSLSCRKQILPSPGGIFSPSSDVFSCL